MFLQAFLLISVPLAVVADGPRLSDLQQDLHRLAFVRHHVPSNPTNNLLVLNSQLGPLARITNALYLEQQLASAKPESDAILAELLNLGDLKVLEEAATVNWEEIKFVLHALESQSNVSLSNMDDLKSAINSLKELRRTETAVDALSDATQFFADFKDCVTFLGTDVKGHVGNLKSIEVEISDTEKLDLNVTQNTYQDWITSFKSLDASFKTALESVGALEDMVSNACTRLNRSSTSLVPLVQRSRLSTVFSSHSAAIQTLKSTSPDSFRVIQNLISGQADYANYEKHVTALKETVEKIAAASTVYDRKFTPAFRDGVADLAKVTVDLENGWIRDKVLGNTDFFKTALFPMLRLQVAVQSVDQSLHAISLRKEADQSMRTLLSTLGTLSGAKKNVPDARKSQEELMSIASKATNVEVDSSDVVRFNYMLQRVNRDVEMFTLSLSTVIATDHWKSTSSDLETILAANGMKDLTTMADVESAVEKLRNANTFKKMKESWQQSVQLIARTRMVATFENIPIEDTAHKAKMAPTWAEKKFPVLADFFSSLKSSGATETLRLAFSVEELLRRMGKDRETIETVQFTVSDLEAATENWEFTKRAIEYFGKIKDRNAAIVALKEWVGAEELVRVLGSGSLLIGDLGEALARRQDLEMLVKNADEVGKQIDGLSDQKVKDHIRKRWGESAKVKSSLETLLTEGDSLNKEIPATGAAEPSSLAPMLLKLKSITDPALDLMQMLEAVTLLKRSAAQHSDAVGEAMKALWGLSGLNLQFASRSALVTDATTPLTSLIKLFSSPVAATVALEQSDEKESEEWDEEEESLLGYQIVFGLTVVVGIVVGFFINWLSRTKEIKGEGGVFICLKKQIIGFKGKGSDEKLEKEGKKKQKEVKKGVKGGSKSSENDKKSSESAENASKTPKNDQKKSREGSQPNTPSAESPAPKNANDESQVGHRPNDSITKQLMKVVNDAIEEEKKKKEENWSDSERL